MSKVLQNKTYELKFFSVSLNNVDILCVAEYWLQDKEVCYFSMKNFKMASSFCRNKYKHGGVAIFTKEHIICKNISFTTHLNEEKHFEHAVTQINLAFKKKYCGSLLI